MYYIYVKSVYIVCIFIYIKISQMLKKKNVAKVHHIQYNETLQNTGNQNYPDTNFKL